MYKVINDDDVQLTVLEDNNRVRRQCTIIYNVHLNKSQLLNTLQCGLCLSVSLYYYVVLFYSVLNCTTVPNIFVQKFSFNRILVRRKYETCTLIEILETLTGAVVNAEYFAGGLTM